MSDDDWTLRPVSRRRRDRDLLAFAGACEALAAVAPRSGRYEGLAARARAMHGTDHDHDAVAELGREFGSGPNPHDPGPAAEHRRVEPSQLAAAAAYRRAHECAVQLRVVAEPVLWRSVVDLLTPGPVQRWVSGRRRSG